MNNDLKILDDVLTASIADNIEDIMIELKHNFPWYYAKHIVQSVTFEADDTSAFYHMFMIDNEIKTSFFSSIILPLLAHINFKKIIRVKANLYTKELENINTGFHTDTKGENKVAIYSVNSNNGCTLLEDGTKIESIKNRLAIFNDVPHAAVTQTDQRRRINIVINYEEN